MSTNIALLDELRTLAFGSISGTFAAVGGPTDFPTRLICFTNTTDADMIFTMDGVTDQVFVAASGFKLFDVTTNHRPINQDDFCFATGTQWSVRQLAAPSSGNVYIEIIYVQP